MELKALPVPDGRLDHYTQTDDPLPDDLIPVLSNYLNNLTDALETLHLSARSSEIPQHDTASVENATKVRAKYQALKDSLSLRQLPLEIIYQIIVATLDARNSDRYRQGHRFVDTDPITLNILRRVCRAWNEAALCQPELWRGLEIDLSLWYPSHTVPNLARFANAWYDRAGEGAPVRLALPPLVIDKEGRDPWRVQKFQNDNWSSFTNQLLSIVLAKRNWVEWSFDSIPFYSVCLHKGGLEYIAGTLDDAGKGPEPAARVWSHIRELSLGLSADAGGLDAPRRGLGLFSKRNLVPALRSLYIHSIPLHHPNRFECLPARLRSLHLHQHFYFSPAVLSQFPALEELILESSQAHHDKPTRDIDRWWPATQPHPMNTLKRLIFIGTHTTSKIILRALSSFTFPSLKLLKFVGSPLSASSDIVRFYAFSASVGKYIAQSRPVGVTLSLEELGASAVDVADFISALDSEMDGAHAHEFVSHLRLADARTLYHVQPPSGAGGHNLDAYATIACRSFGLPSDETPIVGVPRLEHVELYVPRDRPAQEDADDLAKSASNLKAISHSELDVLFSYGIEGHRYMQAKETCRAWIEPEPEAPTVALGC